MYNPWSFVKYPEKEVSPSTEEEVIRKIGRLTSTKTQLIILRENGFKEKFRLNEITSVRLHQKSRVKYPALGLALALILILSFGTFGYYFIPRLVDTQNPMVIGSQGRMAGMLLIAVLGFSAVGFYLLFTTTMGGEWWWLELTASGRTYDFPLAKTKAIQEQDLLAALSEMHLPL
ncbi:hypothetical protein [Candidatus Manganitrophus noduliformans]|uniref:Uncharacterized protein n=1 Tax=Candidatus Manganitrophus noduliformans TaxID=2606439 RepID=A0A7X6DNU6_9BACT|nr:hypothetical protein [Candidatus Manganitrophus noduliformans]NKE70605.1 hypothetical protein [Candidatus Manganitrophus noduliformans]